MQIPEGICCAPLRAADVRANARTLVDFAKASNASVGTFKDAILELQTPSLLTQNNHRANLEIVWDAPHAGFAEALSDLMGRAALPSDWEYSAHERTEIQSKLDEGMKIYSSVFPDHFSAFNEMTTHLILARRAGYGGGSVSNRVGMIWLAPAIDCSPQEYAENLLHEFLHQCLFLDEMVHSIFTDGSFRLDQEDAKALSAIRRERRGYDKSFHSAFVAYGVAVFYSATGDADKAASFIPPLVICLEDLAAKDQFLTTHGKELLRGLITVVLSLRVRNAALEESPVA